MRQRIVGVSELIDKIGTLLFRDALPDILVVLRVALTYIGAGQDNLCTHRAQVEDFLLAHLVGQHQDQLVAFLSRDQCQAQAGVPCRCFEECVAGADVTALFRFLDHRDTDTILDRAARIHEFELEEQAARAGVEMCKLKHWCSTDEVENVGIDVHSVRAEAAGMVTIESGVQCTRCARRATTVGSRR